MASLSLIFAFGCALALFRSKFSAPLLPLVLALVALGFWVALPWVGANVVLRNVESGLCCLALKFLGEWFRRLSGALSQAFTAFDVPESSRNEHKWYNQVPPGPLGLASFFLLLVGFPLTAAAVLLVTYFLPINYRNTLESRKLLGIFAALVIAQLGYKFVVQGHVNNHSLGLPILPILLFIGEKWGNQISVAIRRGRQAPPRSSPAPGSLARPSDSRPPS